MKTRPGQVGRRALPAAASLIDISDCLYDQVAAPTVPARRAPMVGTSAQQPTFHSRLTPMVQSTDLPCRKSAGGGGANGTGDAFSRCDATESSVMPSPGSRDYALIFQLVCVGAVQAAAPTVLAKACSRCGDTKPASVFNINKTTSSGLTSHCKVLTSVKSSDILCVCARLHSTKPAFNINKANLLGADQPLQGAERLILQRLAVQVQLPPPNLRSSTSTSAHPWGRPATAWCRIKMQGPAA